MTDFDLRAIKSRAEATARFARDFLPDLGLWGGDTSDIDQAFGPDTDSLQLIDKLAADVLALLGRVEELEYKNSALSWLLGEGGGEIPFRLPDAMEQLRARVAELEAQLIAARAEQVTR